MRLIDADELIKRIGKLAPEDPCGREQTEEEIIATDIVASVYMEIEETPTAFDKEKVLTEIGECYADAISLYNSHKGTAYAYSEEVRKDTWEKSKEIVEKGGIG